MSSPNRTGFQNRKKTCLAVFEVVEEDVEALTLDTVILDNNARAANDLARVTLAIHLAKASPGTKDLGVTDLDQVDLVFSAKRLNQLDVLRLCASLDKDAQVSLALVEGLGTLAQTAGESIVNESVLQNLLQPNERGTITPVASNLT